MGKLKDGTIRLSASSLGLFLDCPRCFWLEMNEGVHRPRGVFPSLPGGMDLVIKDYFDTWRVKGELPPEIRGKVKGELLPDIRLLNAWRNWRTGLTYEDKKQKTILIGALDDCLIEGDRYTPLDYKTRGSAPKDDTTRYYQHQLDIYSLLLEVNKYPPSGHAWLVYYFPREVSEGGVVKFEVEPHEVKSSAIRGRELFENAVALLRDLKPKQHSSCAWCSWGASLDFD